MPLSKRAILTAELISEVEIFVVRTFDGIKRPSVSASLMTTSPGHAGRVALVIIAVQKSIRRAQAAR